jgi:hypothetical protein
VWQLEERKLVCVTEKEEDHKQGSRLRGEDSRGDEDGDSREWWRCQWVLLGAPHLLNCRVRQRERGDGRFLLSDFFYSQTVIRVVTVGASISVRPMGAQNVTHTSHPLSANVIPSHGLIILHDDVTRVD